MIKRKITVSECQFNNQGHCTNAVSCSHSKEKPVQLMQKHLAELRLSILSECQAGMCLICGKPIEDKNAVLDHQHKKKLKGSGLVRGVLCLTCNLFLARSENGAARCKVTMEMLPQVLRNMASYLEKKHYPYIHPSEKERDPLLKKASYNKLKKKMETLVGKGKTKIPDFPASGKLTVPIKKLFDLYSIEPEFYK